MNVKTETVGGVSIVRVGETRLMYPILSDFSTAVSGLVSTGKKDILIDLTPVTYVDSATIGCLMDLYRQVNNAGGSPNHAADKNSVGKSLMDNGGKDILHDNIIEHTAATS